MEASTEEGKEEKEEKKVMVFLFWARVQKEADENRPELWVDLIFSWYG